MVGIRFSGCRLFYPLPTEENRANYYRKSRAIFIFLLVCLFLLLKSHTKSTTRSNRRRQRQRRRQRRRKTALREALVTFGPPRHGPACPSIARLYQAGQSGGRTGPDLRRR